MAGERTILRGTTVVDFRDGSAWIETIAETHAAV
jgi:hypothetical protein